MKVYITKWAISDKQGIYYDEVQPCTYDHRFVYRVYKRVNANGEVMEKKSLYKPGEWFHTLEEAIARVNELIDLAVAGLDRKKNRMLKLKESEVKLLDEDGHCLGTTALIEEEINHPGQLPATKVAGL